MVLCRIAFVLLISLAAGCGRSDENTVENLNKLRSLGLLSSHPDVSLSALLSGQNIPLEVTSIDFHPEDLGEAVPQRAYEWTLCFSVGPLLKYECIDDALSVRANTTEPVFTYDINYASLMELLPPEFFEGADGEGSDEFLLSTGDELTSCPAEVGRPCDPSNECEDGLVCVENVCNLPPSISPIPLVVRAVISVASGESVTVARAINLRFTGVDNRDPAPGALEIGSGRLNLIDVREGCQTVGPFAPGLGEIPLAFEASDGSWDTYLDYREGQCVEVNESADAFISWYVSGGKLERPVGTLDFAENTLDLGSELEEPFRLYVAQRDGRNGLVLSCVDFEVTPASTELESD